MEVSTLPTFTKKKRKNKKAKKKNGASSKRKSSDSASRFDFICFGLALLVFVSTYFYVEIMNTHQDAKQRSALQASRYGMKNVEKLKGKVKNLKRKIRVLRKQMSEHNNPIPGIESSKRTETMSRVIKQANHVKASPKFESPSQYHTDESNHYSRGNDADRSSKQDGRQGELTHTTVAAPATKTHEMVSTRELPALDYGTPGTPGADGMKVRGGALGGRRKPFGTQCFHSKQYSFTFVHVHKNGGSAIADNLRRIICKHHNIYLKKVPVNNYRTCATNLWTTGCENLGKDDWFDFTFSRNPWDRYVSMWSYTLKRQQLKTKDLDKREKMSLRYCKFHEFVKSGGKKCPAFHSEAQWISMFTAGGEPLLNFIGRLEYFKRDFGRVLKRISTELFETYNKIGFEMANDSAHKKYTEYYTSPQLIKKVRYKYRKDINLLGYDFETGGNLGGFKPQSYHDGKPARDLNFGHIG